MKCDSTGFTYITVQFRFACIVDCNESGPRGIRKPRHATPHPFCPRVQQTFNATESLKCAIDIATDP